MFCKHFTLLVPVKTFQNILLTSNCYHNKALGLAADELGLSKIILRGPCAYSCSLHKIDTLVKTTCLTLVKVRVPQYKGKSVEKPSVTYNNHLKASEKGYKVGFLN